MNVEQIKYALSLLKVGKFKVGQKRVSVSCPFAPYLHEKGTDKHPSAFLTIKPTGVSHFKCYSCGTGGDLTTLTYKLQKLAGKGAYPYGKLIDLATDEEDGVELDIPDYDEISHVSAEPVIWDEHYLASFIRADQNPEAIEYIRDRGFKYKDWIWLDLRYDTGKKRVCFPMRDWNGNLVGLRGRDITRKSEIPYLAYTENDHYNSMIWYGEQHIDYTERLILTESVFDYLSMCRVFPKTEVLASLTCTISEGQFERIKWVDEIVTAYDHGKGGDQAREAIDKYFSGVPTQHLIPSKEQDDFGAMTVQEVEAYWGTVI